MSLAPGGRPRPAAGPRSLLAVSALVLGGSACLALLNSCGERHPESRAEDPPRNEMRTVREYRRTERRFVSVFTREDSFVRWTLPATVAFRRIQDESGATREERSIETVFWPNGDRTDFRDCALSGNLIGDCIDEQGRPWRAKIFAKATDEVPREDQYPKGAVPAPFALHP